VKCDRKLGTSGMTRNVRGSGGDQGKCEMNRCQKECERNRRNVRGPGGM